MVTLEKISLQGFKSFKRQVSIPFPPGFSLITGPNGCGKSNICDAITFVIGKASSRVLRAKKAQDLIFHGGKNKPGSDFARVCLYFDNSNNELPFKEKTVTISRRLNKKGVSTYRLNGKIVTRQQILDALVQVGIHPNGHNIIHQGDVNQIIEMDPVERREIIDEISGILEYNEKKEKAMQDLKKIEERVREAELILQEKQTIVEKLKQERDTALRYKQLSSDLEKIRKSILWKEYHKSEKNIEEINKKLEEKTKEMQEVEAKIKEYDKKIAEEEKRLEELTSKILKTSAQVKVAEKIASLKSELEIKKEKIEYNRREIDRLNLMIEKLGSLDAKASPAVRAVLGMDGVEGMVGDLITVPAEYRIAVEIAASGHLTDIVVDKASNAIKCIKYLKQNKIGRVRFLPLDKIKPPPKKPLPSGAIGWLSELIHHEPKYTPAIDYIFSTTAAVKDIDRAKAIFEKQRARLVTLEGDLIDPSGVITGGFYKKPASYNVKKYIEEKKRIEKETEKLEEEVAAITKELEIFSSKEKPTKTINIERERAKSDESLKRMKEERKEFYERLLVLQQETGKLSIQKARFEARFDDLRIQWERSKEGKETNPEELKPFIDFETPTLKNKERETILEIESLGPVNMKAIEDFEEIKTEFENFREKVDKIVEEKNSIEDTIRDIEEKRIEVFMHTLNEISKHFREVYKGLTGGEARLSLEVPNDLESGLVIQVQPEGKKLFHIDSMSGGEKTLTAFAFLFAIQRYKPSPFYLLDEADAALDKVNTKRVAELIKRHSKFAQFIVISHNDALIREADRVYGISMEDGESKIIAIELPKNQENN
ncbi:MAG: hypothetical protein DRP13_02730 [Candidatus Aenigmatarchaeota archaeon]|nr:MAG: hypothetical protein DRP13_02730 [Candidatus Aenigmarchaeota archaeon]